MRRTVQGAGQEFLRGSEGVGSNIFMKSPGQGFGFGKGGGGKGGCGEGVWDMVGEKKEKWGASWRARRARERE